MLREGTVPNAAEINKEPEIIVHEICKEEFEDGWMKYANASKR